MININNLKNAREKREFSQQQVANRLCISQQAYAKWEAGEANPRADKLPELARIFGCTIDELFAADGGKHG